jgi:hypothetical protein
MPAKLAAPLIISAVTTCSPTIRVQGIVDSEVVIENAVGARLGAESITTPEADIPVNVSLMSANELWATCSVTDASGTRRSDKGPKVRPLSAPAAGQHTSPRQPLYSNARGVAIEGVAPGSELSLYRPPGTALAGPVTAEGGTAVIGFPAGRGYPDSGCILRQRGCGGPPPADRNLPPGTRFPGSQLPRLRSPGVCECSRSIKVAGIVPGAEVILQRGNGTSHGWIVMNDQTDFDVVPPVARNETLRLNQQFASDDPRPSEPLEIRATAVVTPPAPWIVGLLCRNSPLLHAKGLWPGADVQLLDPSGTVLYEMTAPDEQAPFPLSGLPAIPHVTLRQGLCGHWSPPSDPPTPLQENIGNLTAGIAQPYDCEREVWITDLTPGTDVSLYLERDAGGVPQDRPLLASGFAAGHTLVLNVAPELLAGEDLLVIASACQIAKSAPAHVDKINELALPRIDPLTAGKAVVKMHNLGGRQALHPGPPQVLPNQPASTRPADAR